MNNLLNFIELVDDDLTPEEKRIRAYRQFMDSNFFAKLSNKNFIPPNIVYKDSRFTVERIIETYLNGVKIC